MRITTVVRILSAVLVKSSFLQEIVLLQISSFLYYDLQVLLFVFPNMS